MPKKHYMLCKFERANKNQMGTWEESSWEAYWLTKKSILIKNLTENRQLKLNVNPNGEANLVS